MLQRTAYLDASVKRAHYLPPCSQRFALLVGLDGLEPSTSRLSGARSSHLSYRPLFTHGLFVRPSVPSLMGFEPNFSSYAREIGFA